MEPRISIITLGVSNLARSIEFYRDGLGLPLRPGEENIAFFETRGTWLALFSRESLAEDASVPTSGNGSPRFTLAHNVRSKEEVDELIDHAVSVGGTVVKPAHDTDWGGYSGYFADPDGFLWEVCWNPFFWIE